MVEVPTVAQEPVAAGIGDPCPCPRSLRRRGERGIATDPSTSEAAWPSCALSYREAGSGAAADRRVDIALVIKRAVRAPARPGDSRHTQILLA